jgi:hypothetical protein
LQFRRRGQRRKKDRKAQKADPGHPSFTDAAPYDSRILFSVFEFFENHWFLPECDVFFTRETTTRVDRGEFFVLTPRR